MSKCLRDNARYIFRAMCCLMAASGRVSDPAVTAAYFQLSRIGRLPSPEVFQGLLKSTVMKLQQDGVFESAMGLRSPLCIIRENAEGAFALRAIETVAESIHSPGGHVGELLRFFQATLTGISVQHSESPDMNDEDVQAAARELVQNLQNPPIVAAADRCAPTDLHSAHETFQGSPVSRVKIFSAASSLVRSEVLPEAYRTRIVKQVLEILQGSTHKRGNASACRCTACGRRYWFDLSAANHGAICPFCGSHQRATVDWHPISVRPVVPAWKPHRVTGLSATTGGPVHVTSCLTKKGHFRRAHTRARPRRRK